MWISQVRFHALYQSTVKAMQLQNLDFGGGGGTK